MSQQIKISKREQHSQGQHVEEKRLEKEFSANVQLPDKADLMHAHLF